MLHRDDYVQETADQVIKQCLWQSNVSCEPEYPFELSIPSQHYRPLYADPALTNPHIQIHK